MPVTAPGRKGCTPSKHYLGPELALAGLGLGLARDGMGKSPLLAQVGSFTSGSGGSELQTLSAPASAQEKLCQPTPD